MRLFSLSVPVLPILLGVGAYYLALTNQPDVASNWLRHPNNPVFQDFIPEEAYEVASDPHVFFDDAGELSMIYTGDTDGYPSIKLAKGQSWSAWRPGEAVLPPTVSSGQDTHKETPFYLKAPNGKHQIYYIGYPDETSYESEVYLAEADALEGPYTPLDKPVILKGVIAGEDVYCITSPSVLEHEGVLYVVFLGWNASPNEVTEVWVLGATSTDNGHTWSDFQQVGTRIGMEGQVTKTPDGTFQAVRTGEYEDGEAIFLSSAPHPFGPWAEQAQPILVQAGPPLEKDEIIAPQLTYDPATNEPYLYYTGADYEKGWWVMLAEMEGSQN